MRLRLKSFLNCSMGLYSKFVLPKIVNCVCGLKPTRKQREKVVPQATGKVLEIGIGSGLNLPFYNAEQVAHITGIDPAPEMWELNSWKGDIEVNYVQSSAEDLNLENDSFDSIVCTYTLCTIPNAQKALSEIMRVLKPNGKFIFTEHGLAPDPSVMKTQNRINPYWKRLGGGCNLNRNMEELISESGFKFSSFDKMYIPGWKPASFNYWGVAEKIKV